MERIITVASITIDLERLKSVKLNNFSNLGETDTLILEYNDRIEYSKNPFTNEIDKTVMVDVVSKQFPDFETAQLYQIEIQEVWQEYLSNKK